MESSLIEDPNLTRHPIENIDEAVGCYLDAVDRSELVGGVRCICPDG